VTSYIALLRGINVGGNRKIHMADLRDVFAAAGCEDVTSYIQSGNVIFTHRAAGDELAADLEKHIEAATGFDVPVILRTAQAWEGVVRANPYAGVEPTALHVAFLAQPPAADAVAAFDAARFAPEEFTVVGREVYLHLPDGIGRAKLPPALPLIRGIGTARNWRTVLKLAELSGDLAARSSP
jgi:uncharacterized protein (DUF1697 family)